MQAIEFETELKNGLIRLPVSFQNWQDGKNVKVILLVDEATEEKSIVENSFSINRHAGKINLTQAPLDFQNNLRDEWS